MTKQNIKELDMSFHRLDTYEDIVEYLQKEKGIYTDSLTESFYGREVRPKRFPKRDVQLKYINKNFNSFKKWVTKRFDIEYNENACRKRRLSEYTSKKALAWCLLNWDSKRKEKRRYFCDECQAWHLTSKPNKNG